VKTKFPPLSSTAPKKGGWKLKSQGSTGFEVVAYLEGSSHLLPKRIARSYS
jgi:hypothetical protein